MKTVYRFGACEAEVDRWSEGRALILSLRTDFLCRHHGHATQVMREIVADADREGVRLKLWVEPDPDSPLTVEQLRSWYSRFGFVDDGPPAEMARPPTIDLFGKVRVG